MAGLRTTASLGADQDYIRGRASDDAMYGGDITAAGGGAADAFAVQTGSGDDWVYEFEVRIDYLDLWGNCALVSHARGRG